MSFPLMTQDLARQLEQSKSDHIESWLQAMREQPGNPFEVDILQRGNVKAFVTRSLPEMSLFNQVIGFGPTEKEHFHEIIQFYHDHGIEQYRLEVNPYHASPDFLALLAAHGFYQSSFEAYLYGVVSFDVPSSSNSIIIRDVTSSDPDLFADIHVEGFREALSRFSEKARRLYRESIKVLYQHPGWHLYLAYINNTPSGMGMLYIHDGKALLAGGATIPHMRRQGCQAALLRHRMLASAHAKCSLIIGQTNVGSTSQHNMERLGMRIAYTGTMNKLNRSHVDAYSNNKGA
jgi:hypothetical protein